jgi:hypothetical protein
VRTIVESTHALRLRIIYPMAIKASQRAEMRSALRFATLRVIALKTDHLAIRIAKRHRDRPLHRTCLI